MELVIVERQLDRPRTFAELQAAEDAALWCFNLHEVQAVVSYLSKDRMRMVCLYQAPDAESVRTANRQAGLPFEAVWSADTFQPHSEDPDSADPDSAEPHPAEPQPTEPTT